MESIKQASIREMDVAIFVARGASYIFTQNIAQAIIGITALAFIARLISKTEMGVYTTIMLIVSAAQIAATVGLSSAGTKFIAELQGKSDREASAGVAYKILITAFTISIAVAILISIFSRELSIYLTRDIAYEGLFRLLPIVSILAGPMLNLSGILLGLKKIKQLAVIGIVYSAAMWGISIPLLVLGYGLYGILYGLIASEIVYVTLSLVLTVKCLGPPTFKFKLRRLLKFSWPLSISDWASFANNWFDSEAIWKSWAASITMAISALSMQYVWYNKFLLPIYILVGAAVYLLMLRVLNAGRPRDFALMKLYVGKRFEFTVNFLEKLLLTHRRD